MIRRIRRITHGECDEATTLSLSLSTKGGLNQNKIKYKFKFNLIESGESIIASKHPEVLQASIKLDLA